MKGLLQISLIVAAVIFLPAIGLWGLRRALEPASPMEWHRYARDRYQDNKTGIICGRYTYDSTNSDLHIPNASLRWLPEEGCPVRSRTGYVFTEHIMTKGGSEAETLLRQGWVAE